MKISSSFDSNYSTKQRQSFNGIHPNPLFLPERIGKIGKWAGEYVSMPEQKLFLATTAFIFQPAIDMKFAEEDKKSDVAIKSAAKAIAGGLTGVTIRALFEKYLNDKIGYEDNGFRKYNKVSDYLFPTKAAKLHEVSPSAADIQLRKYCSTLGVMASLLVMILITNEQLDVPITSDLQDLFTGVARDNKDLEQSFKDVLNARIEKIKKWFGGGKDFLISSKNKAKRIVEILKEDNTTVKNTGKIEGASNEASKT